MAFLLQAPDGFKGSCAVLNTFPQDVLLETLYQVTRFLSYKVALLDSASLAAKLEAVGLGHSPDAVKGALNALVFIFRGAMNEKLAVEDLIGALRQSTVLGSTVIPVIKHVWTEQSAALLAVAQTKAFSVGQLVGFEWKLAIATEASTLSHLETPYVTLALRVADPNGAVSATSLTLTVSEFKNFLAQVKTVSSTLETL